MLYIGLASSSASGKAGGLVARRGQAGTQFRARIVPRQSLTPSSSQARAITAGLPGLWRLLTPAEQSSWADLAATLPAIDALGQPTTLSGYALYMACSRRLITIGITTPLTEAPAQPSIPAIYGLVATPIYDNPLEPTTLYDIQLSTAAPLPPNFLPVLRASAALSPTRASIPASDFRIIQAGVAWPSGPLSALNLWQAVYGTTPPGGQITFALSLVDPISGLVGAEVRSGTPFTVSPSPPPPADSVTIQVEGTTVAVIPGYTVQVEGTTVAN